MKGCPRGLLGGLFPEEEGMGTTHVLNREELGQASWAL